MMHEEHFTVPFPFQKIIDYARQDLYSQNLVVADEAQSWRIISHGNHTIKLSVIFDTPHGQYDVWLSFNLETGQIEGATQ